MDRSHADRVVSIRQDRNRHNVISNAQIKPGNISLSPWLNAAHCYFHRSLPHFPISSATSVLVINSMNDLRSPMAIVVPQAAPASAKAREELASA
jgi:hypothetical protein